MTKFFNVYRKLQVPAICQLIWLIHIGIHTTCFSIPSVFKAYKISFPNTNEHFLGVVVRPDYEGPVVPLPQLESFDASWTLSELKTINHSQAINFQNALSELVWADAKDKGYLNANTQAHYESEIFHIREGQWPFTLLMRFPEDFNNGSFPVKKEEILLSLCFAPTDPLFLPMVSRMFPPSQSIRDPLASDLMNASRSDIIQDVNFTVYSHTSNGRLEYDPIIGLELGLKPYAINGGVEAKFLVGNGKTPIRFLPPLAALAIKHQLYFQSPREVEESTRLFLDDAKYPLPSHAQREWRLEYYRNLANTAGSEQKRLWYRWLLNYIKDPSFQRYFINRSVYLQVSDLRGEAPTPNALSEFFRRSFGLPYPFAQIDEDNSFGTFGVRTDLYATTLSEFITSLAHVAWHFPSRYRIGDMQLNSPTLDKRGEEPASCLDLLADWQRSYQLFQDESF